MTQPQAKLIKLDALTGMRFFAAYAVLLHHLQSHLALPVLTIPLFGLFGMENWEIDVGRFDLAKSAVSFFFVLSGFVLAYNYDGKLKPEGRVKFWFQRFARIYPAHLFTLLCAVFLLPRQSDFGDYQWWEWLRLVLHGTLLQSWVPIDKYVFAHNGVAWSISVEFFFYAMFPFLLASGKRLFWICLLLASVAVISYSMIDWYFIQFDPLTEFSQKRISHTFPPARLLEFACGILAARFFAARSSFLPKSIKLSTAIELAVVGLFIANHYLIGAIPRYIAQGFGEAWAVSGWVRFSGELGAFLVAIVVLAHGRGLLSRLLSTKVLVYLGEISFSLYLSHQIILRLFDRYDLYQSQFGYWMDLFAVHVAVIAASSFIYHFIEMPFKKKLTDLYDRRDKFGFKYLTGFLHPLRTLPVLASCFIVAATFFFEFNTQGIAKVSQESFDAKDLTRITKNSPEAYQNVIFKGRARLLGYDAKVEDKVLKLDIVYRPMAAKAEELQWVIQAVDESGKPIGAFHQDRTIEANNGDSSRYLSRFSLPLQRITQDFRVTVTLQHGIVEKTGNPRIILVQNGPAIQNGKRLVLGKFELDQAQQGSRKQNKRERQKSALIPETYDVDSQSNATNFSTAG